ASQRVDDFSEAVDRQLVPVKPTDGISSSLTIDLGEISQRSAGTHEPVAGTKTADSRLGQMASDVIAQATELLGRGRIGGEKLLTQSKGAKRQAHGSAWTTPRESGDLHTASAEIEEQAARSRKSPHCPSETVVRFSGPADNLDSHAELA